MLMKVMMRGDEASQCNELWNELKNMMYDVINALCLIRVREDVSSHLFPIKCFPCLIVLIMT